MAENTKGTLDFEQRIYLAEEFIELNRRRLIGALVATPVITLVVLLFAELNLGLDLAWWMWVAVVIAELPVLYGTYLGGLKLLQKWVQRKYDIDIQLEEYPGG